MPQVEGGGAEAPKKPKPQPKSTASDIVSSKRQSTSAVPKRVAPHPLATPQRESFVAPVQNDLRHLAPPIVFQAQKPINRVADTDPAYLVALDTRARNINAAFAEKHPGEAAALLVSAVPTSQLASVSRRYNSLAGWAGQNLSVEGVPYFLVPYYQKAWNAPSAERRAEALAFLDEVRQQPPGSMYQFLQEHTTEFGDLVADHTAGGVASAVGMGIVGAPFVLGAEGLHGGVTALGAGADAGLTSVGLGGWGDKIRAGANWVGDVASGTPEFLGKGTRLAYGTAIAGAQTIMGYDAKDAFMRYAWDPSFGDAQGLGPAARYFFDVTGLDPEQYEGLAAVIDTGGDVIGGFAIFRGAAAYKRMASTPASLGGWRRGADWVEKTRAGRKFVDTVDEVVEVARKQDEDPVAYLLSNTSKRMPVALAKELVDSPTKAARKRVIANWADDIPHPGDFMALRQELRDIHKQLRDVNSPIRFEEWRAKRQAGTPDPVMVPVEWLRERTSNPTPRDGATLLRTDKGPSGKTGYQKIARDLVDNGWDPQKPLGVVYDHKTGEFTIWEGTHRLGLADELGITEIPVEFMGNADLANTYAMLQKEFPQHFQRNVPVAEVELLARKAAAEQRIADLNQREQTPLFEWPEVSRLRPIIMDAPRNNFQRAMATLYRNVNVRSKVLDVRTFMDDMSPHQRTIYNPEDARTNPPGWQEQSVKTLLDDWRIMRMDPKTQRALVADYIRGVGNDAWDFYEWQQRVIGAEKTALSRGGRRNLELVPEAKELLQTSARSAEDATHVPYDVVGATSDGIPLRERHNVLEGPDGWPQPVLEGDWLSHWERSSIETLRSASSTLHYADQWARNKPYWGKAYGTLSTTVQGARFVAFTAVRLLMKPLLFVTRPLILGGKVQFDQGLRAAVMGMKPLEVWGRRNIDFLPDGTPLKSGVRVQDLLPPGEVAPGVKMNPRTGQPMGDMSLLGVLRETSVFDSQPFHHTVTTRHLDPNHHKAEIVEAADGMYSQLMRYRNSPLARMVASRGAEGTLRFIQENPGSSITHYVNTRLQKSANKAGVDIPTAISRIDEAITQATGGRADLRRTISTGRWSRQEGKSAPTAYEREVMVRMQEIDDLKAREEQARATGNRTEEMEMAARWEQLDEEIRSIERRATREAPGLDFGNKHSIVEALREEHATGAYRFPEQVQVTSRKTRFEEHIEGGLLGRVHTQMARMSDWLYRGLKPVSWADAQLTRGSMYFQLLERNTNALVKRGYSRERAYELAQYRAAWQTRDLMYDLSARSSFDRAVKDVFWFAPVLREQLTTWLFKIPNEAYWPVGFMALAGTTSNVIDDFVRMGFARRNEDGELLVNVPFIGDMLGKFQGAPVEFRVDSLNPVTPGGSTVIPTLPPGAETLLQFGQSRGYFKAIKPFLEGVSRNFTFDHGEVGTNWMPTGINGFLQLMGVNAPYKDQWNPTMWEYADRAAHTQSMQWAMSELAEEGVVAPEPGAPEEDFEKYTELVEAKAADFEGGTQLWRGVSYLFSPMSITATAPAKKKYDAFLRKNGIEYPFTDEDYATIRAYVRENPELLPYTIGRYAASDTPQLPTGAPLADKIWVGDVTPLTGDEYMVKAFTTMGFAAEEQRLRSELRAVGIEEPGDRLRNWDKYQKVQAEHLIRMEKWFVANPEIETYLKERSDLSPKQEVILETMRNLRILEDGYDVKVESSDVGAVRAALNQALKDEVFGPPETEADKVITHFFDRVYDPYRQRVDPLYDQVGIFFASGQKGAAFKVLDQIRAINNEYAAGSNFMGHSLPSPEEFSFNSKSPKQRQITRLDWTLSNPQNLSSFQLDTIGIHDFEGRDMLSLGLSGIDDRIFGALDNPELSDDQRDALYHRRDLERKALAQKFGVEGVQFERLTSMTPSDRLAATGFGSDNFYWNAAVADAQGIVAYAIAKGSSPQFAAESTGVFERKVEFEKRINFWRAIDPQFDRLWRTLSRAAAPYGQDFKLGVPLYEHVFFGQTSNDYNYQDPLVAAVERN